MVMECIKLPDENNIDVDSNLMGADLGNALKDKKVKTVIIKDTYELNLPAYLIDMSDVGDVTEASLKAIEALLREDGDTHLYIKNNDASLYAGAGDGMMLYTILDNLLSKLFNDKCKLYFNNGEGFYLIKQMDVYSVRLNL